MMIQQVIVRALAFLYVIAALLMKDGELKTEVLRLSVYTFIPSTIPT